MQHPSGRPRRLLTTYLTACIALTPALHADVIIDLKNGVVTETFAGTSPAPQSGAPSFDSADGYLHVQLNKKTTGCTPTPFEAKVDVNLAPSNSAPAKRMSVLVEYEGTP